MELEYLQPRSRQPEVETWKNKIHACVPLSFLAEDLPRWA